MDKFRKYQTLAVLGLAGGAIYFLPYVKYVFYDAQIAAMGITNVQSGTLLTMHTIANMLLYIPGGILADKFAPRFSLTISLLATAALCFLYAFTFNYTLSLGIWVGLSFTTGFVFWSSLMKAVRIVGTEEEQGLMYGIYYACNGIAGAITQSLALYAYSTTTDITAGFFRAVCTGGVIVAIAGVLVFLLLKTEKAEDAEEDKFKMSDVGVLFRKPTVWMFSIVVFCGYGIYSCVSYFTPYLTEVVGISATESGVFSIIRTWGFLMLAPVGGLIADKWLKSTALWVSIAMCILACLFVGVLFLPPDMSSFGVSLYTLLPGAFGMMMYGVVFSIVSEAGIPRLMTGTTIGLASIIGYLPDSIYHTLFGKWLDSFGGAVGYQYIFTFLGASAVLGAIMAFLIYRSNRAVVKVKMNTA